MNLLDYYRNVIGKSLFKSTHKVDNYTTGLSKIPPERLEYMLKNNVANAMVEYIQNKRPDFFTMEDNGQVTQIDCELVIMTKESFTEMFKEISDGRR